MAYPPKTERNRELVKKRKQDPRKWSFAKLAEHYGITKQAVHEAYHGELRRQGLSTGKSEEILA